MGRIMNKISYKELSGKDHCYGCGLCATVCKAGVLIMRLNSQGFYVPQALNPEKCVECGLCSRVCSCHSESLPNFCEATDAYAGWSNQPDIRYYSSSGGVAAEIAMFAVDRGYKVCSVRYNSSKKRAEHYIATTKEELEGSIGSKYLQSYTFDAFSDININEKYVIIGTPCQIDMWRRYLKIRKKEDNFILIDFFCHGVPTMNLWKKYLREQKNILPNSKITWRDKISGWHSSWNICAYSSDQKKSVNPYYRSSAIEDKDLFYSLFLGNYCLNRSCYAECKYKMNNSSADIRLGDFWGTTYSKVDNGVNSILVFTPKGFQIIKDANITMVEHTLKEVCDGQMHKPVKKPWFYAICACVLRLPFVKLSTIRSAIVIEEVVSYKIKKLFKKNR